MMINGRFVDTSPRAAAKEVAAEWPAGTWRSTQVLRASVREVLGRHGDGVATRDPDGVLRILQAGTRDGLWETVEPGSRTRGWVRAGGPLARPQHVGLDGEVYPLYTP